MVAELVKEKQIVLAEFKANRDRVAARSVKSLSTHFNLVKEAVRNAPAGVQKEQVLTYLTLFGF